MPGGLVFRPESLSVTGAADLDSAAVTATGEADGTGTLDLKVFFPEVNYPPMNWRA